MRLSLVIPTYNERENILNITKIIQKELNESKINGEIIFVDDNSPDGTGKILLNLKKRYKNIKVIIRNKKLGLSSAVLDGWKISSGDVLGVMDADFSHPPEKIKDLFYPIARNEADVTIGSRYINGGKIENWNLKRKIISKIATFLTRFYTNVKDPLSGFFMVKKSVITNVNFNSKGFKILLEVLIKGKYKKVKEIPIVFRGRAKGKSKLNVKEFFYFIFNLIQYTNYRLKLLN